jgi:hypothetical protein
MEELEKYELFVTITKTEADTYEWGIGQELEIGGKPSFEFLAGGEEESLTEASLRVSEEIKTLF